MKTYISKMMVGNALKTIVAVNYKQETQESKEVTVDRLHHVHMLDRSYSMSSDLRGLLKNVEQTLELMSDNDLISVIWFSGEGQCKTVFKGKSKKDSDDIKALLSTLASPVGCTCFSEPLQELNEVINDLEVLCPNFNATLFTDGAPCVSDYNKEMNDIWSIMDVLKDRVMAINSIGYGYYYNKELLEKISGMTTFGRLIHSSQISDYADIFSHNYEILSNMIVEKVDINVDKPCEILYLSNKNTKFVKDSLHLDFLNKTKNQFFFILDDEDANITINDTTINVSEVKSKIQTATLNNLFYSLAYELYYLGRAEEALDIMAINLKDKAFVDKHINAFTAEERESYMKEINKAIFSNKLRLAEGECEEGYIPKEDAFCVMDLFKLLSQGQNFYIPLSSDEYKRIGLKVSDNFNLFQSKKDYTPLAPLNEIVFNAKHLNISIRYMVEGHVNINPIDAKKLDMPKQIDSRIFRMQTIIKDGNLNVNTLKVRVDGSTYNRLAELNAKGIVKFDEIIKDLQSNFAGDDTLTVESVDITFDLTKLPIINRMYAKQSNLENILENVKDIQVLKARQKVVKYYIDELKDKSYNSKKTAGFTDFNADQIRLLESHGLNAKLDYQGIDLERSEKNEEDYYESRMLEFGLKGWSSLPKVEDVISGKKKNAPALAMKEAVNLTTPIFESNDLTDKTKLMQLTDLLESIKNKIMVKTIEMNTQKMSKVLTGGWWEGLETDSKGNFNYTNIAEDGTKDTLVIKNGMVKVYF